MMIMMMRSMTISTQYRTEPIGAVSIPFSLGSPLVRSSHSLKMPEMYEKMCSTSRMKMIVSVKPR